MKFYAPGLIFILPRAIIACRLNKSEVIIMHGDCHMHMVLDGIYYKDAIATHKGHVRDDLIHERLAAYARAGIMYLRDGGDAFGVAQRAAQLAGEYGIEYRTPCFPICLKGRYGAFIGNAFETMAEYRGLVARVKREGGDFIKLMVSGLMDFNEFGKITSEPLTFMQMKEMMHIAHEEGFAVMAHANGSETVCNAIEAGVDSIEHGAYLDEPALQAIADSSVVWVPTSVTIGNLIGDGRFPDEVLKPLHQLHLDNIARCVELGGCVALGSDNGAYRVTHPQGTMDEYAYLKRAIGEKTDEVLAEGERRIKARFRRN